MSRQIICMFVLAVLIIAIAGCASRKLYIIKTDVTAEELKDVGKVYVTLNDGSTIELSKVEMENGVLKGTTDAVESKELNMQDVQSIKVDQKHGKPGIAFLIGVGSGISFLLFLALVGG